MATRKKSKPTAAPTLAYMNAPKLSPAQRAQVVARVAAGESQRDVAKRFGVARGTIAKLVARAAKPKGSSEPPLPPWSGLTKQLTDPELPVASPLAEADVDPNRRAIDALRSALANAEAGAKDARAIGNTTLAQRFSRDVANIGIALGRLEKLEAKDDGAIVFTKEEYLATEEKLIQRMRAELGGVQEKLRCFDCARALAIKWGTGVE